MFPTTNLGPWIKLRRKALDLTQDALARKIGYAVSTVRKIESGDLRPSREVTERLAVCLEIPPADRATFVHIARVSSLLDPESSPLAAAGTAYRPLPTNPIALIGREREISYVKRQLLQQDTRLITLLGPPGIGKSRLAIAVAGTLTAAFPDRICFVALETVTNPWGVLTAIREALDVGEQVARPLLASIQAAIQQQSFLLVLDTMEHLLAAAPDILALLQACPHLKILVTSRSRLHVEGEQSITVLPLTKPPRSPLPPWTSLDAYDAILLFVSCARLVQPAFAITAANAAAVAAICERLDGVPLAIELIAARIKIMPPHILLERLETLLDASPQRQSDRPARQHTLRAAIAWSHRLLSSEEQRLFRRLGIFKDGFNRAAVEAIYTALSDDPQTVAARIDALCDHSIVQRQQNWGGEDIFTMLTVLREYALEQLSSSGEQGQIEAAYVGYYLGLAEQAQAHFRRAQEQRWLDTLTQEHDNLRAILQWGLATGRPEVSLKLAGMLWRFWMFRGHVSEGRRWLAQALAVETVSDPAIRASALHAAGALASLQADYTQASAAYGECLALRRALHDRAGLAITLLNSGSIARQQGDESSAEAMLSDAMALYGDFQDQQGLGMCLTERGLLLQGQGAYASSAQCFREALEIQTSLDNQYGIANLLALQGSLALDQHQDDQARLLFSAALEQLRNLGDRQSLHRPLDGLAALLLGAGNLRAAQAYWLECLNHALALEQPQVVVKALEGFARLTGAAGQAQPAARLWGLTTALRARLRYPVSARLKQVHQQSQEHARARLDAATWAAAFREGATMSVEQAVAMVMDAL
jgi:predicted ATPase/DNA-binding XRE family transcriptional regulator